MLSFGKNGLEARTAELLQLTRCEVVVPEGANKPFTVKKQGRHIRLAEGELNLNAGPVRIQGKESPDDVVAGIMDIELVLSSWSRFDYKLVVIGGALDCERLEIVFTDTRGHQYSVELHEDIPMVHTVGFRHYAPSIHQIDIYQY